MVAVDGVVSSIPLSELVLSLDPLPPDEVVDAARRLRYRDLLVVGLISTDPEPFPDNWIYLHDPGHPRRQGAELRRLEPRDDPSRIHVSRGRVLLLPG